jgi:multiple sugar transport system permease protein
VTRRFVTTARLWVVLRYLVAALFALVLVIPLAWAVSGSLHSNATLFSDPYEWLPKVAQWENYSSSWGQVSFGRDMLNSFGIALVLATIGVFLGLMAGYALGKCRFMGRDLIFWAIVSTLLLPFPAILIPVFIIATKLGLVNTYLGVIVPGLLTAQVVFFMRQYVLGIPDELIECARVDGASELRLYLKIVLPLCWPVFASMAVLVFVGSWNNLLWPLVVINSSSLYTVPLGLTHFSSQYFTNYAGTLAMSVVGALPVLVLFVVVRRRILDSVMVSSGAVKG